METKKFKPFDKVLVKDTFGVWNCAFYSHWSDEDKTHNLTSLVPAKGNDILPYEGNEHLVGSQDSPDEEVRLEEGEWIIANDREYPLEIGHGALGRCIRVEWNGFVECSAYERNGIKYNYAIRLKDFNPNDMEETKKHILCVKNGKIVRYKG